MPLIEGALVIVAVDTNLFIYWLNSQSRFHLQATDFLKSSIDKNHSLICSTLVITELLSKKGSSIENVSELPIEWMAPDKTIAQKAGLLRQHYSGLKTPDAIHVATAIIARADCFITNDQVILKLKKVEGLTIISLA